MIMDLIKTERLELRPLELSHAEQLLPIWSDEEVVKTTYIYGINTVEDCENRIARVINNAMSRDNNLGPYAIFYGDNLIGIVGATRDSAYEYGLAYHLGKEYWGQGFATEAAKAVVDEAFRVMDIIRVSADALTTNPASSRVLEKVGMKYEGCQRMKFHRNGVHGDFNIYSILRSEYTRV